MPENANQHYVPQFYFRQFNGGTERICVLLLKNGRIVPTAPIKGQCARHMFYGTPEIEKQFSHLEGQHAAAFRALIMAATTGDVARFSNDHLPALLQAILFQRARTMLEVEKISPAMESMLLHVFKGYVRETQPPERLDEFLGPIERGEVQIIENPTVTVFRQIRVAFESSLLLVDMQPCIIRNHTDYPFLFSDSPVVFYNTYYRRIVDRGVLGLQTPGLQIFMPLTANLQLMLFDPAVYTGACRNAPFCDVSQRGDVSQLNALQLHHSRLALYFANPDDSEYVTELHWSHRHRLVKPEAAFRVRNDMCVRGEAPDEILHTFEPQLNHELSLSFVDCVPVSPRDFVFRHRTPEIVEEHKRLYPGDHDGEI